MHVPHALEDKYGLTAEELLDAIDRRFRLKVALEGAVAEVHFGRKIKIGTQEGWLADYEEHDEDGKHDYTVETLGKKSIRVEVKTISKRPGRKVELQKTRAAKGDPSSRYYNNDHFDVVAVCMGRKTGDWSEFRYVLVRDLPPHAMYPQKIQVMHAISDDPNCTPRWYSKFQEVINALEK